MTRTTELTPGPSAAVVESYRETVIAAGALTTGPFLREAIGHLARLSSAEASSILLVDGGQLRHGAAVGLPAAYTAAIDGVTISPTVGTCGLAVATGLPNVTPDIREDPNWAGFAAVAEAANLRSCWSVPIKTPDGRVLGTFASYASTPGEPAPDELRAVLEYAPIVALGLESIRHQAELARNSESIVVALASALDSRDEYTASHSSQTAALAARVGVRLGLGQAALESLSRTAMLHDIGKLGIPNEILGKPGPLDAEEWKIMRRHPVIGERILARVPFLEDVARAVRHEHERWDGTGYPDGLAGERIPLASRIVLVCDSYHAMTSDRPYRAAMAADVARDELRDHAGSQFDPAVVSALLTELGAPAPEPRATPHLAHVQARDHALEAVAEQLGATDVFVLRPTGGDRWTHIDGLGRGSGWAGNLELRTGEEARLLEVLEDGGPVVIDTPEPRHILGPYHARSAVLVRAPGGEVVVFGSGTGSLATLDAGRLADLAHRAARAVGDVPSAKILEDELEVLDAVRSVTTVTSDALADALSAMSECAAAALSCEFAAMIAVPGPGRDAVIGKAAAGWTPSGDRVLRAAMTELLSRSGELPLLAQDTGTLGHRLELEGFGPADGITSLQALAVGGPGGAVLLLAHASTTPRGFTKLCRRVAGAMADAAHPVVRRAVAREQLARENTELARRVATDALTGVASRAWWEERMADDAQAGDAAPRPMTVVVVDLDDLKAVNDAHGHAAGDALLRACARLLREAAGQGNQVARIGGDEFAVLLHDTGPEGAAAWCTTLRSAACEERRRTPGLALTFSLGWGSTGPGIGLYAALAHADEDMYADKRAGKRSAD